MQGGIMNDDVLPPGFDRSLVRTSTTTTTVPVVSQEKKIDSVSSSVSTSDKVYPKKYKTGLCSDFMKGHCHKGDSCNFAHGKADVRVFGQANVFLSDLPKYMIKTRMCKFWERGEPCPHGMKKCHFAHGK